MNLVRSVHLLNSLLGSSIYLLIADAVVSFWQFIQVWWIKCESMLPLQAEQEQEATSWRQKSRRCRRNTGELEDEDEDEDEDKLDAHIRLYGLSEKGRSGVFMISSRFFARLHLCVSVHLKQVVAILK